MQPTFNTESLIEQDIAHMFHPVTNLHRHRQSGPLVLVSGSGVRVTDSSGKTYIDGFAGLWNVNVGHGRTELADVARDQMARLAFQPTFFGLATPPAIELSSKLASMLPQQHFQFTSGGAESNETALKIARYYWALSGKPLKQKIISRRMAYHGIAMGALAATGVAAYWQDFGALPSGFIHITPPFDYRANPGLSEADFIAHLVHDLEQTIEREGADSIAAMIGEPVQGAGGVVIPPENYWRAIAPVLKKHNILLIADEVITGFGRLGVPFGADYFGVVPDMLTFAKGVTNGVIPLGGVICRGALYDQMMNTNAPEHVIEFFHGYTYSGHPVACAAAIATLQLQAEEKLFERAGTMGKLLGDAMHAAFKDLPGVVSVRTLGLAGAVEVAPLKGVPAKRAYDIFLDCYQRGLLVRPAGENIVLCPPFVVTEAQIEQMVGMLADGIKRYM